MNIYTLFSNLILLVHFAFVAFILGGLLVIWVGYWCGWDFVRNFCFRVGHLLAMTVVVLESIVGFMCPLTIWEYQLRVRAGEKNPYEDSFLQHWVGRIMFYDLDERVFTAAYAVVFAAIVLTLWAVPPRKRHGPSAHP